MKNMRKFASLLLALVMVLSLAISASAVNITIDDGDVNGAVYSAYKLLNATVDGEKYAYTLNEDYTTILQKETGKTTQADIVAYIQALDEAGIREFADDVYAAIVSANPTINADATSSSGVLTGLGEGYYLIAETTLGSYADGTTDVYSLVMLDTAGQSDFNIKSKEEKPSIEKKVNNQNAVDAAIGETVEFTLTSKVPDMTGYDVYYYVVNDTLSEGLTLDDSTITVKIGDTTLTKDTGYTVTKTDVTGDNNTETGETALKIVFKNFEQYKDDPKTETVNESKEGQTITITYKATLDSDAVIDGDGNLNKVNLTYSNNPYYNYNGDVDEPGEDDPKGVTPDAVTKTYTTELKIWKYEMKDGTKTALSGATFRITGESVKTDVKTGEAFVVSDEGTYYLLDDGSYTTTAPGAQDSADNSKYADVETTYAKVEATTTSTSSETVNMTGESGEDGYITFTGLGEGTYTITEIVTPDGYNTAAPSTVTISFDNDSFTFTGTTTRDDGAINVVEIENQSGSILPETGGIGTTMFYVFGGVLVVAAVILLVTKKRMASAE